MMANTYELLMKIGGKLESSFGSSMSKASKSLSTLSKVTKPISSGLSSVKNKILGLAAGAAAGITLDAVSTSATGATQAMAQMGAVLKSTHNAAGMTQQQLINLADAQLKTTTYSKTATEQAENMLLTFTNIKSNVFPQTIAVAEDMATAMGTDTKSAALTLGKALNDPATGLSKLTKQGVTFTETQKKQIQAMEKAGNVAGAQKLMIAELQKEFGGSAKAAGDTIPGQMTKIKNSIMNTAVTAFTAFMPIVASIVPSVVGGAQKIAGFVQTHQKDITAATNNIIGVGKAILSVVIPAAQSLFSVFAPTVNNIIPALQSGIATVVKFIQNHQKDIQQVSSTINTIGQTVLNIAGKAIKDVMNFVSQNGPVVEGIIAGIGTAFALWKVAGLVMGIVKALKAFKTAQEASTIAQAALNLVLKANPIGIVITAIAAVVAALVILYNKNKMFRDFVNAAFKQIQKVIGAVINFAIVHFKLFWTVVSGILQILKAGIGVALSAIVGYFKAWFSGIQAVFGNLQAIFTNVIDLIKNVFTGNWKAAWQNVVNIFGNIFGMIVNIAKMPINALIGLINGAIDGINKIHVSFPQGIPLVGGKTFGFNIPKIPQLANGGIIQHRSGGILANIGEGRYDEAVVPLKNGALSGTGGGTSVNFTYSPNIEVKGTASKEDISNILDDDRAKFEKQMNNWIREHKRRSPSGQVVFS